MEETSLIEVKEILFQAATSSRECTLFRLACSGGGVRADLVNAALRDWLDFLCRRHIRAGMVGDEFVES